MPTTIGNPAKPQHVSAIWSEDRLGCDLGMTRRGTRTADQTTPKAMIAAAANAIGVLASRGLATIVDTGWATIKYTRLVSTSQTYGARRSDAPRRSSSRFTVTECRSAQAHAMHKRQRRSHPSASKPPPSVIWARVQTGLRWVRAVGRDRMVAAWPWMGRPHT